MENRSKLSLNTGVRRSLPLVFSASFFGLIFGFTGAAGDLPLLWVSSMSYIIFAGAAQFITLVLLIEGEEMLAVVLVAVVLNLRHLLYGAVLHTKLEFTGLKKMVTAYFLTDEAFLVTSLVDKEEPELQSDLVLLGAGVTLWLFWNAATIAGFLIYRIGEGIILLPDNFVIAASFVGFLLEHFIKYPQDRGVLLFSSVVTLVLGWLTSSSILLLAVMIAGAGYAMVTQYLEERP